MSWRRAPRPGPAGPPRFQTVLTTASLVGALCAQLETPTLKAAPKNSDPEFEFSARVIWRSEGTTRHAQLFVKGDRYRIEHSAGVRTDLGFAGVSIVREDQNEVWYVLSQRRSYLALPLTTEHMLPLATELEGELDRTLIGDAMAGGRPAQLYEVVVERYGRRETYFEWIDEEHGLLLKLLSKHRDWSVEYEHVVFSEQPWYYFEAPRGYRRIEGHERPG